MMFILFNNFHVAFLCSSCRASGQEGIIFQYYLCIKLCLPGLPFVLCLRVIHISVSLLEVWWCED